MIGSMIPKKYLVLLILLILILMICLGGCESESWGVSRCDAQLDSQGTAIENMSAHHSCLPSYDADEQANCGGVGKCTFVVQWNKEQPIVWVWDKNVPSNHNLKVYASEGECHVRAFREGRVVGYAAGVPQAVYQECYSWAVGVNP